MGFSDKYRIGCIPAYTYGDYVYFNNNKICTWGTSNSINIENKNKYLYNIIVEVDGWNIEIFA